jgi:NADH dehydrogenase
MSFPSPRPLRLDRNIIPRIQRQCLRSQTAPAPRPYAQQRFFSFNGSSYRLHNATSSRPSVIATQTQGLRRPALQWNRHISTKELPRYNSRLARFAYRSFTYLGLTVVVVGSAVVLFFLYDASTYKSDPSVEDLQVSEIALNPRRGGPKNLPIAEHLIDDDDCEKTRGVKHKPKLVILGTGWGSVAILKTLNADQYHVTVVSPSNHFLFTPMLPSATVGTLELRSLVEPVRRILARIKGHFIKAMAEDVDFSEKLVECSSIGPNGEKQSFYLPYDKLIIGVGKLSLAKLFSSFIHTKKYRFCNKSSWCQRPRELPFLEGHH